MSSRYVECPFYKKNDENGIMCEGVSKGNHIRLVFKSKKERDEYAHNFCRSVSMCQKCVIHNALWMKHE